MFHLLPPFLFLEYPPAFRSGEYWLHLQPNFKTTLFMNQNDLFQTFLISDFYNAVKNMYYLEFISYCKEVLDKLENLDISPKGFYHEKADAIRKLHRFVKGAEHYVRCEGSAPKDASELDLSFMKSILDGMKKRQGLG